MLVLNLKTGDDDDDEGEHEEDDGSPRLGNGSNNLAFPGGLLLVSGNPVGNLCKSILNN